MMLWTRLAKAVGGKALEEVSRTMYEEKLEEKCKSTAINTAQCCGCTDREG